MAKIQTSCPRCKSPLIADVEQLFDLNVDPQAKQRLLNGQVNNVNCPTCGYQGMLSTPIVYHDPGKELLLTFVPSELGLPLNEQEKLLGPMITQVTNKLPPEKRKAYLLRPQAMFTFQTMIEKILEGDGISKEMIDEQQKKLNLLQRLLSIPQAVDRAEVIKQEEALIDQTFFVMLGRLIEATMGQGDQRGARMLSDLQQELITQTKVGQELQIQSQEVQEAIKDLQEAGKKGLTRETLLELIIDAAEKPIRLSTLVGMARTGLDYQFYQMLTERINAAEGDEKTKLEVLRDKLLEFTAKMDEQARLQTEDTRKVLNQILSEPDVEQALQQHLEEIDETFVELLQSELQAARANADLEKIAKLQKINKFIEEASAPPPELALIEQLLDTESYDDRMKILKDNSDMVTPEFIQLLSQLINQSETQDQPEEIIAKLKEIHRIALRVSMMTAMNK